MAAIFTQLYPGETTAKPPGSIAAASRSPRMPILIVLFLLFTTAARADGLLPGLLSAPLLVPVTISGSELSLDGFVIRPDRPG